MAYVIHLFERLLGFASNVAWYIVDLFASKIVECNTGFWLTNILRKYQDDQGDDDDDDDDDDDVICIV